MTGWDWMLIGIVASGVVMLYAIYFDDRDQSVTPGDD